MILDSRPGQVVAAHTMRPYTCMHMQTRARPAARRAPNSPHPRAQYPQNPSKPSGRKINAETRLPARALIFPAPSSGPGDNGKSPSSRKFRKSQPSFGPTGGSRLAGPGVPRDATRTHARGQGRRRAQAQVVGASRCALAEREIEARKKSRQRARGGYRATEAHARRGRQG